MNLHITRHERKGPETRWTFPEVSHVPAEGEKLVLDNSLHVVKGKIINYEMGTVSLDVVPV